jgi:aminoglycoside/choline kinase family phosphotransferase
VELTAELTPAQTGFLESSIKGFSLTEWNVELAGQAASTRRFFRVSRGEESYILVEWDSKDEDWPRFLEIGSYTSPTIDFLPRIFANDPVHGLILEEDLGAVTLKQFCNDNDDDSSIQYGNGTISNDNHHSNSMIDDMYRRVIDALCVWQGLDVSNCHAITSRAMDGEMFLWESGYFARHCVTEFFARESLLSPDWESERQQMAARAANIPRVCIHRDFQSENVMIRDGKIRFVDFQGARLGPPYYDLASLLLDPYITQLSDDSVEKLLDYYLDKRGLAPTSKADFYLCAAQRLMQALGAYGNLTLHKGKPQYRQFIPIALKKLSCVFNRLPDYPAMGAVVKICSDGTKSNNNNNDMDGTRPLRGQPYPTL